MPNTDKKCETFETKILFLFLFQKLETKKDSLFLLSFFCQPSFVRLSNIIFVSPFIFSTRKDTKIISVEFLF
jgi:hypothetical protein